MHFTCLLNQLACSLKKEWAWLEARYPIRLFFDQQKSKSVSLRYILASGMLIVITYGIDWITAGFYLGFDEPPFYFIFLLTTLLTTGLFALPLSNQIEALIGGNHRSLLQKGTAELPLLGSCVSIFLLVLAIIGLIHTELVDRFDHLHWVAWLFAWTAFTFSLMTQVIFFQGLLLLGVINSLGLMVLPMMFLVQSVFYSQLGFMSFLDHCLITLVLSWLCLRTGTLYAAFYALILSSAIAGFFVGPVGLR